MVNFPTQFSDCDSRSPALLDFFLSSETSICPAIVFPPFGNSYHVVFSVSIDISSKSKWDALFYRIGYDYSRADLDGLRDHLRDVPWEALLMLLVNFGIGFRLELMYISLIVSIRSSLTHIHGVQLLLLLP